MKSEFLRKTMTNFEKKKWLSVMIDPIINVKYNIYLLVLLFLFNAMPTNSINNYYFLSQK